MSAPGPQPQPGPGQLGRCQKVIWPGTRVVLGEVVGGGFGIWSIAGGEPIAMYPQNEDGWNTATHQWLAWERPVPPPSPPSRNIVIPISTVLVILVIVVVYIAYHSYRYQNCIATPGILSWPSSCF